LLVQYMANGVLAAREGCKTIAIVTPAGNGDVNALVQAGAQSVKSNIKVPIVTIGEPQPDYGPTISNAIADNADCLVLETPPQDATRIFTAVQQTGHKFKMFANSASVSPQSLQTMGSASNGVFFETDPQSLPNSAPMMQEIAKAIKAQNPKAALDSFAVYAWAATQVLKLAGPHMSAMTPQALAAALPKIGTVNLGFYAPFSYAKPLPVAAFARLVNTTVYGWVSHNGQYVPVSSQPINVNKLLVEVGKGG
jgi:ABC-type branched-subunit amino acid transport system substrate-binding protein